MALSANPTHAVYPEGQQMFTSTFTIKLKPSKEHYIKINDNTVFEWKTNVITPPNTPAQPISAVEDQMIKKLSQAEQQQSAVHPVKGPSIPMFIYDKEDDLRTSLDKFMSCERFNSQYQKMYQQATQL